MNSSKSAEATVETTAEDLTADKEKEAVETKPEKTPKTIKAETTNTQKTSKAKAKPADKKAGQAEEKTTKKTTKKSPVKKTDKPELKPEVYIEYQGQQALEAAVIEKVKKEYVASGHRVSSIKSLQIYIKPEEFKAYYVINNGKHTGQVFLF